MLLEYRLNLVFLFVAVILGLMLAVHTWRYRKKPLGLYSFLLAASLTFWFFACFVQDASIVYSFKITASKLATLGIAVAAISWLAFVFQYTNRKKSLTRTNILLLAVLPLITQVMVWTNDIHHLMWTSVSWNANIFPSVLTQHNNIWYWINLAYISSLFFLGSVLVMYHYFRSNGIVKNQARLILIFAGVTWVSGVLHYLDVAPFSTLNPTPLAFSITGFYFYLNLSRSKLLDIVPIAHETVFNTIGDGVFVLDEDDNIVDLNTSAENIITHKKSEIIGLSYFKVFSHFPGIPEIKMETREAYAVMKENQRFYEVRLSPIVTREQVNGHVLVFHDDTERRKLEDEARQKIRLEAELTEREKANAQLEVKVTERTEQLMEAVAIAKASSQVKSRFLANMSHELRTPLVAIIGFSQILQEEHLGGLNIKQAEYISDIVNAGKHLLSLINDILDLSRNEAGKMEIEKTNVKIKELLQNSLDVFKERAQAHLLHLQMQIPDELESQEIAIDERRIKQVMLNLLSNAVKFTDEGGSISIEAFKKGSDLAICVSDNGIGISPDEQNKIFSEFYQISNNGRNNTPGTGLGLTICKNIIEKHGGKIWVESEGINKGSQFTFTLPLQPVVNNVKINTG